MLIITYIMGHTLTIAEDTLSAVLSTVNYTGRLEKHTSPRLANRQLKHYFAHLRREAYLKILRSQQRILRDTGSATDHWLVSFCTLLGFAMVLEECQRTIQIQADARVVKGEMEAAGAQAEAVQNCARIDARFAFFVWAFRKKYSKKVWEAGSFGARTPEYRTVAEGAFLGRLRGLVVQRRMFIPRLS